MSPRFQIMNKNKMLRKMMMEDGIIVAPGAHDTATAMIIEKAGFDAVYMGGYAMSASILGKPDVSLMTLTEMATFVRYMDNAVSIPVIADSEAGFGNAINTMRAVKEFEKAGAAAIHLEDKIGPRLWRTKVTRVSPLKEHIKKIEAALEAREDEDFVIIARTDAGEVYGIREAMKRGKAYARAGADVVFVHGLRTVEELRIASRTIDAPQLANYATLVESGATPLPTVEDVEKMGFKIVIYPGFTNLVELKAMKEFLGELKRTGTIEGLAQCMESFAEFANFIGLPESKALEERFLC